MEIKELRLKTPEELLVLERELRVAVRENRFSLASGQATSVTKLRNAKTDLARVLTALRDLTPNA